MKKFIVFLLLGVMFVFNTVAYAQTENNSFFGTTAYGIEFLQLLKKCNGGFRYYGKKSC